MELSAYALERKNVRMLNFACLAASLLLTAGVGAGYVSAPSRHNAPQLVNEVMYYGYDASFLESHNFDKDASSGFSSQSVAFTYSPYDGASVSTLATDGVIEVFLETEEGDPYYLVPDESLSLNTNYVATLDNSNYLYAIVVVPSLSDFDITIDLNLLPLPVDNGRWIFRFSEDSSLSASAVVLYNSYVDGLLAYIPSFTGTNITDAITDGLGAIVPMGGALVTGFDAIALDDGALTPVVTFGFVLMGLGISVGIVKKCFNWVTGRHGM